MSTRMSTRMSVPVSMRRYKHMRLMRNLTWWEFYQEKGDIVYSPGGYGGSIPASPMACLLRWHSCSDTQNDRLGESFPTVCSTCPAGLNTSLCTCLDTSRPHIILRNFTWWEFYQEKGDIVYSPRGSLFFLMSLLFPLSRDERHRALTPRGEGAGGYLPCLFFIFHR